MHCKAGVHCHIISLGFVLQRRSPRAYEGAFVSTLSPLYPLLHVLCLFIDIETDPT